MRHPTAGPVPLALTFLWALLGASLAAQAPGGAPAAVAGTILDTGGEPLAGAEVILHPKLGPETRAALLLAGEAFGKPAARVTTGADGRFRLDAPRPGAWTVVARAPGHLPLTQDPDPLLPPPPGAPARPVELAPVALPTATPVEIRVVGPDGGPAAGAVVVVSGPDSRREDGYPRFGKGWSAARRVALTESDGTARAVVSESDGIRVRVHAGARHGGLEVASGEPQETPLRVTLEPSPTVRLRVASSDGSPAPGVLVRVDFDPVGRTGEDGRIDVPLPSHRKSRLYVASEDGRRASATLEPSDESASEPMYLTLLPPFPVTGRVVDGGSGDPVPGAMVWQSGAPAGAVLADAAGRFHLDGSGDPLRLEIHAAAPGFAGTKRRLARRGDGLASETTVELQPAVWVRGSVTDGDGSPLPGVQVRATPGDSSGSPKPAGDTTWTAPDGGFLLTGLDPTTSVQLAAWAEGRAPAVVEVPPGGTGEDGRSRQGQSVTLVLHPTFRVAGRAIDDQGRPLADAEVTLLPHDRLFEQNLWVHVDELAQPTDAEGRFAFDTPTPKPSLLVIRADGLGPHLRTEIEIDPAAGDLDLGDATLYPEGVLRGRVVDGEGEPVAGAEIHGEMTSFPSIVRDLLDGERGQAPLAVTDARGEFSAGGFVPAEPLMVRAELDGATSEERLTLAAPEPVPVELVLIPPARIAGTVVDADGRPVAGASVAPSNMSTGQQSHFRWARADTDGRFEVTVAEPGRAILVANARGHARSEPVEIEVTGGQRVEDLTLALRRGHTLEGRVVDPAGRPIEGVELSASPGSEVVWTDADGRFAIEDRPAGTVVLNLRQEGHLSRELPVDLVPDGELVEVVLPTAEVTGTLRAADGTPAGGYKVQLTDRESEWWSSTAFQVTTAADGSFRFRGVADGTYLLRVFGPERDIYGWDGPEPVVVDGASVTGVVVTLPRPEEASR